MHEKFGKNFATYHEKKTQVTKQVK